MGQRDRKVCLADALKAGGESEMFYIPVLGSGIHRIIIAAPSPQPLLLTQWTLDVNLLNFEDAWKRQKGPKGAGNLDSTAAEPINSFLLASYLVL